MKKIERNMLSVFTSVSNSKSFLKKLHVLLFLMGTLLMGSKGWGQVAGWDFSALTGGTNNFGASPYAATSSNSNVTVGGLTRGAGFGTSGSGAAAAWGGAEAVTTASSEATGVTTSNFFSLTIAPKSGYTVTLANIAAYNIRRSSTGPGNAIWQYSTNGTSFIDLVAPTTLSGTGSSGNSESSVDLSGIGAVSFPNVITLRLVAWGASATGGTFYFKDLGNSTTNDLIINGTVFQPANYYWGGTTSGLYSHNWDAASNYFSTPSPSSTLVPWVDGNIANFVGATNGGTVTLNANRSFNQANVSGTNFIFSTASGGGSGYQFNGPVVLAASSTLQMPVDGSLTNDATLDFLGNVSGGASSAITLQNNTTTAANSSRFNLAANGVTFSVPTVNITGSGTTLAGFVGSGTSASTTLSSNIVNNSSHITTMLAATSGNTLTFSGQASGSAGLQFSAGTSGGAGTTILSNTSTYNGSTLFNLGNGGTGIVRLGITNALPTGTSLVMASTSGQGGSLQLYGYNQTISNLSQANTDASDVITNGNSSGNSILTVNQSSATNNNISMPLTDGGAGGTLGLTLGASATNTLELSGTNTFTGGVTVNAGTLLLGSTGALNSSSPYNAVTMGGGTLSLNGFAATVNSLSGGSGTVNNNSSSSTAALTVNTTGTPSYSSLIADGSTKALSLTKSGSGTLSLSGANTYTGGTTLSAGQLNINAAAALGIGTFTISAGTIDNTSAADVTTTNAQSWGGSFTYAGSAHNLMQTTGAVTITTSPTITVTANNLSIGGIISGSSKSITKAGNGTLTLSGANTYTGGTTLSAGQLNINAAAALGTGTFTISAGTIDNTSAADVTTTNAQSWGGSFTYAGSAHNLLQTTGAVTITTSPTITVTANNLSIGGIISGSSKSITKAGNGTLTLSGANTYTGGTTLSAGQLNINAAAALGTGTFTISAGTIDNTSAADVTTTNAQSWGGSFTYAGSAHNLLQTTGAVTITTSPAITVTANNLSIGGIIGGSSKSITKAGNGTLTLSGANTYTGGTTLSAGQLNINAAAALGTGTFTISAGTIDNTSAADVTTTNAQSWGGSFTYAGSAHNLLQTTGAVTITTSPTITVTANTLSIGGAIGDGGNNYSLTKAGSGTLTLTGVNTYTGATIVNAGSLIISKTGYTATITNPSSNTTVVIAFSPSPSLGTYVILPGALSVNGIISFSATGLGANQSATFNASNSTVTVVSTDATLSALTTTAGSLSPAFASSTISYSTTNVSNTNTTVTVTPTVNQANATVKVNGTTVSSGSASGNISLSVGSNTINVVVTAQDGTTTKTYTITVIRNSTDATLSALTTTAGSLSPTFVSGTNSYSTTNVSNANTTVTVTPTVNQANATVKVNGTTVSSGSASGNISLSVGSNTINIVVTAQDGNTNTYTITVVRNSTDATLSSLTTTAGSLSPTFASGTNSYTTTSVSNATTTITVTPTVNEANASVKVNGTTVTSGGASGNISLSVGSNTINVVVTAQDGNTNTYSIAIIRQNLPTLSVSNSPVNYIGTVQSATVVGSVAGTVSNVKYNGSSTVPTAAGTYTITADFVPTDAINFGNLSGASAGNFIINHATLTITANNQTVCYGSDPSSVTGTGGYSVSGYQNVDGLSVISGLGSISYTTTYTSTTAAGTTGITITPVVSGLSATNYTFSAANGNITVTDNTWTGTTSADWNTGSNWCSGTVPASGDNVIIPPTSNAPTLPSSGVIKVGDITGTNTIYLNGNTLTVNGNISSGTTFSGTLASSLIIGSGASGTLTFDATTDSVTNGLNNLSINGGSVTLSNPLHIYGKLNVSSGSLDLTNKHLTLHSNASGTASVAAVNDGTHGTLSNASNVSVQRYHIDHRAWLLISAPLTTAGALSGLNGDIHSNWQAYTYITGPSSPVYGLDAGTNTSYGIKYWNGSAWSNGFSSSSTATTSTPNTLFGGTGGTTADNKPFSLFVRGDRSALPTTAGSHSTATLVATGALQTGTKYSVLGTGTYSLVANPYAAPLDLNAFLTDNSALTPAAVNGVYTTTFYYWDANLSTTGGYTTAYYSSVAGWQYASQNTGVNTAPGYIQSGQAFFVVTNGQSNVTFNESQKSTANSSNGVFGTSGTGTISVNLSKGSPFTMIDGVTTLYNNNFSATVLHPEDAVKFWGNEENIGIVRNGNYLSLEARPVPGLTDTTFLYMSNLVAGTNTYNFTITGTNMPANATGYLVDNYLGTQTPLNLASVTRINFAVTSVAGSKASNRFMILFTNTNPLSVDGMQIKASVKGKSVKVDWKVVTEKNVDHYEVERSNDAASFVSLASQSASNVNNSGYTYTDNQAASGVEYYRIKAISKDGTIQYSSVARVYIGDSKEGINIYPNPVAGNVFNLQMNNIVKGTYHVNIINTAGQIVESNSINHEAGSSTENVAIRKLASGVYTVSVTGEGGAYHTEMIVK